MKFRLRRTLQFVAASACVMVYINFLTSFSVKPDFRTAEDGRAVDVMGLVDLQYLHRTPRPDQATFFVDSVCITCAQFLMTSSVNGCLSRPFLVTSSLHGCLSRGFFVTASAWGCFFKWVSSCRVSSTCISDISFRLRLGCQGACFWVILFISLSNPTTQWSAIA